MFTVPDVALLLGAPLPRHGLTAPRLRLTLASGACAGALIGAVLAMGLGHLGAGGVAMLVAAVAVLGVLGVAAAWAVQRSPRWERAAWLAGSGRAVLAAALIIAATAMFTALAGRDADAL